MKKTTKEKVKEELIDLGLLGFLLLLATLIGIA